MRVLADRVIAKLVRHWGIPNMDQTRSQCNWVFTELLHQQNVSHSNDEDFCCSYGRYLHSCRVCRLQSCALKPCGCTRFLHAAPWIRACWQLSLHDCLKTACMFQICCHPLRLPLKTNQLHSPLLNFLNSELPINCPCRVHWKIKKHVLLS